MTEYSIETHWSLGGGTLAPNRYSPDHDIVLGRGLDLPGSAAPDYGGDPGRANPEQLLAGALSSCHMMTFLALSAKAGWNVSTYSDHAVARLGKAPGGATKVAAVALHPRVGFAAGTEVEATALKEMHERAHRYCFVANSLDLEMSVTPQEWN